jgi:release factor glutamine methyltransferase
MTRPAASSATLASTAAPFDVAARLRDAGCVFADDEAEVLVAAARSAYELESMVAQRSTGVPLEHIVGWAEFYGLRVTVEPGVFVPRRRTELLVREAVARTRPYSIVVDLCCGSGAVGAAIIAAVDHIELHAADVDPAAVGCACTNLAGSHVYEGDLVDPLPAALRGRVDVLVVNAPYVPTSAIRTLPAEARVHEARIALDGGADGLDVQRRVAAAAPVWLAAGGHVLIETSDHQAAGTAEILRANGFVPTVAHDDDLDATVVVGTRLIVADGAGR